MKKYYVYSYLREDLASPYYIGKGSDRRAYTSQSKDRRVPRDKSRIFIVKDNLSEDDAHELERLLILMWGRKIDGGVLQNLSEGGTTPPNPTGRKASAETRRRMSEANKRRWANPEYKAKASAAMSKAWEKRDKTHITNLRTATLSKK